MLGALAGRASDIAYDLAFCGGEDDLLFKLS